MPPSCTPLATCGSRTCPTPRSARPATLSCASRARGIAPARAYIEELLPDVLAGRLEPGRVFDRTIALDETPDGYRAMNEREAIKVLIA